MLFCLIFSKKKPKNSQNGHFWPISGKKIRHFGPVTGKFPLACYASGPRGFTGQIWTKNKGEQNKLSDNGEKQREQGGESSVWAKAKFSLPYLGVPNNACQPTGDFLQFPMMSRYFGKYQFSISPPPLEHNCVSETIYLWNAKLARPVPAAGGHQRKPGGRRHVKPENGSKPALFWEFRANAKVKISSFLPILGVEGNARGIFAACPKDTAHVAVHVRIKMVNGSQLLFYQKNHMCFSRDHYGCVYHKNKKICCLCVFIKSVVRRLMNHPFPLWQQWEKH